MQRFFIVLSFITILGCKKDADLSGSIYIPDSEHAELPAYTEWGYNTFGAFYNRNVFSYSNYQVPLNITVSGDELAFLFQGQYDGYSEMILKIIAKRTNVSAYQDLLSYNDSIIDLDTELTRVEMTKNGEDKEIEILEGQLHIKRTQKVFVDDKEYGIIVSGTFYVKFLENKLPSIIGDGRFDLSVNDNNFFKLTP